MANVSTHIVFPAMVSMDEVGTSINTVRAEIQHLKSSQTRLL